MPRPKTSPEIEDRVAYFAEQGYRPPAITRLVEEESLEKGWSPPSETTVRRLYQAHKGKSPEEQRDYAVFHWPNSMEDAGIPWEASRVVLDLVSGGLPHTIGHAKWLWRVFHAAPEMSRYDRNIAAHWLERRETHKGPDAEVVARAVEAYIQYQPWDWEYKEEDNSEYAGKQLNMLQASGVPAKRLVKALHIKGILQFVQLVMASRQYFGEELPDAYSWAGLRPIKDDEHIEGDIGDMSWLYDELLEEDKP